MIAVRIIQWIARVAGLGALILGLLFWIAQGDLISFHMLFGLTLALSLLVLGLVLVSTSWIRLLGAAGVVHALILPSLGLRQPMLLVGTLPWLIQTGHLLCGLAAVALAQ